MKITTADGMVFEGTMAEYEEFLAFAERKVAEGDSPAITFEGAEYRKVDREAREGDVVILRGSNRSWFSNGVPRLVTDGLEIRDDEGDYFKVYGESRGRTRETVDVYEPVAEPTYEPKLKAGDFVTVNSVVYTDGFTPGKIYEVEADTSGIFVLDDDGDERRYVLQDGDYEIVDAETTKWAKLGRKVNEYKVGDVVRVLDTRGTVALKVGQITTVAEDGVTEAGSSTVNTIDSGTRFAVVELIAPVESLFTQN